MEEDRGAAIFAGFRARVDDPAARPERRISLPDLVLAIGGNLATFVACFAPWMTWQLRNTDTGAMTPGRENGFATDGWIVAACCVVAVVAFAVATLKSDQSLLATVGCAASVLGLVTVFSLWIVLGMAAPTGAEAVHAQWGIFATMAASMVATFGSIRAMRTARIY